MTEETQALVAAVEKLHETVYSMSGSNEIEAHRTIRDAAAALTALARDLETARQEREAAREFLGRDLAQSRDRNLELEIENQRLSAAVRAARAETWAEAAEVVKTAAVFRDGAQSFSPVELRYAIVSICNERAAREGQ